LSEHKSIFGVEGEMPTIEELTEMVNAAAGDPQKLEEAVKAALTELGGAQARIKEVNTESAERRKKLEALEKAEEERKKAETTELERIKAEAEEAKKRAEDVAAQAKKDKVNHLVEMTAIELGFADPADALKMADLSNVIDGEGGKAEAKKALEALLKVKPYLKKEEGKAPDLDGKRRNNVTGSIEDEILAQKRAQYGGL
jgi:uncharacterized membrane protein YqiK